MFSAGVLCEASLTNDVLSHYFGIYTFAKYGENIRPSCVLKILSCFLIPRVFLGKDDRKELRYIKICRIELKR